MRTKFGLISVVATGLLFLLIGTSSALAAKPEVTGKPESAGKPITVGKPVEVGQPKIL